MVYWKVYIDDFDDFIEYIINKYKNFDNATNLSQFNFYYRYRGKRDALLLCVDMLDNKNDKYYLSCCYDDYSDIKWLSENNYIYKGEFKSRKKKLDKLNIISKL